MSREAKALAACVEYVQANLEIKRLKNLISYALGDCCEAWHEANKDAVHGAYFSHLSQAYAPAIVSYGPDDLDQIFKTPEEQAELLQACPHCLAAHNAIQERKKQRQRLGIAKRQITNIGRAA